jgi:Protein of unknown function DUF262
MSLQEEIDRQRGEIRTDGYSVSLGEWISIYEKRELDIHPEFQRFFRWSPRQKSRLIESVFLGIPIPQIFVAQRPDGVWDVVDGVQRLSTIFQFVGILRDENDRLLSPLTLEATKYLPSMAGKAWDDPDHPDRSLTPAQRLLVKRSKIDVSIILKESDEATKYELFQRLNSGGSQLSDQELRNSIIVMLSKDVYRWMKALAEDESFRDCVALSDRAVEEQYDMELVLRFIVFRALREEELGSIGDMGDFLTDKAVQLASDRAFDARGEEEAFRTTFALLRQTLASDSFRRYDVTRRRFVGGFSVSAFEVVALGVGYNYRRLQHSAPTLLERVQALWANPEFTENSGSGVRASSRVPRIVPLGRRVFGQ